MQKRVSTLRVLASWQVSVRRLGAIEAPRLEAWRFSGTAEVAPFYEAGSMRFLCRSGLARCAFWRVNKLA